MGSQSFIKRYEPTFGLAATPWLLVIAIAGLGLILSPKLAIVVIAGAVFLYTIAWRHRAWAITIAMMLTLVPPAYVGDRYNIFPFPLYFEVIPAGLLILMGLIWIDSLVHRDPKPLQITKDTTSVWIMLFYAWIIYEIAHGLANGHSRISMWEDIPHLFSFAFYFYWRHTFAHDGGIKRWFYFLLGLSILISLEYYYMVSIVYTNIIEFMMYRAVTHHAYFSVIALPIVLFMITTRKNWLIKAGGLVIILMMLVQVGLSQQRIAWVTIAEMFAVFGTLYAFRNGFTKRALIQWSTVILGSAALMAIILLIGASYFDIDLATVFTRWDSVAELRDKSLMMRVWDARRAFIKLDGHWLNGMGLGAIIRSSGNLTYASFIDNSYVIATYIGGIPLLVLLVGIYFSGLMKSIKSLAKAQTQQAKLLAISLITSILGLYTLGITDDLIFSFYYIPIWMFMLALANHLYEQLQRGAELNMFDALDVDSSTLSSR